MDAMPATPAHAKPRDHLWVVFVIAAAAAIEVCATWVGIGNVSGFPVIRLPFHLKVNTDFSLMVGMEAYGGFALYYWLSAAPGPRSRAFAMWSAVGALVLSLVGQVAYHVLAAEHVARPPAAVVGFVSSLPVVVLGFAAILMHLVHLDREDADRIVREAGEAARLAAEEAAAADERTALRAELATLAAEVEPLREALAAAQKDAGEANAKAESAAAKLAAQKPNRTRTKAPNAGRRKDPNAAPNGRSRTAPNAAPETEVPDDFDARAEALEIWLANPGISGKDLGAGVGLGERWGQLRKTEFRNASAGSERSDERS